MNCFRSILVLLAIVPAICLAGPVKLKDKTLVAWVAPANLSQRGGSVLTLDDQDTHFDGMVFGEIAEARWMAGSDFYRRTSKAQGGWPSETATGGTFIQMAMVYRGNEVTTYRNGQEYSRHQIKEALEFGKDSAVLMGLRHLEAGDGACFAGAIDDARIYGVALTREQLAALKPNVVSDPKPMAWWNFENGKAQDLMGAYPEASLHGKARIENGKLLLDGKGSYLLTPPAVVAKPPVAAGPAPYEPMPVYHFTSPTGKDCSPFDPNGAVFFKGRYHLGYIYQDGG